MRRTGVIRCSLPILFSLAAVACGAKSRPANDPSTTSTPADTPQTTQSTDTASGQDFDVGVQFEEPKETEAADRTPPPTKSWKPLDKEKPAKNSRQPADATK